MTQVTLEEARDQLADLIKKVSRGEDVTIVEDERPVARLTPIPSFRRSARRGSAKHLVHFMADDFDAHLEEFKDYIE